MRIIIDVRQKTAARAISLHIRALPGARDTVAESNTGRALMLDLQQSFAEDDGRLVIHEDARDFEVLFAGANRRNRAT